MNRLLIQLVFLVKLLTDSYSSMAWEGMPSPQLHADGHFLKNTHGNVVNSEIGVKLRSDVVQKFTTKELAAGIYVVGRNKVLKNGFGY